MWRRCILLTLALALGVLSVLLVPRGPRVQLRAVQRTDAAVSSEAQVQEVSTAPGSTTAGAEGHPSPPVPSDPAVDTWHVPGHCGAEFIDPPCDVFKFIDYDMKKWKDRSVERKQVKAPAKDDRKYALLGSFDGKVFLVYSKSNAKKLDRFLRGQTVDALMSVVSMAVLDVEFLAQTSDVPAVGRKKKKKKKTCDGERFVFSTSSGPEYCDAAPPVGIRPGLNHTIYAMDMPYAQKQNIAFWRGGAHPAPRCGSWSKSPRILMPFASVKHPDVINASLSATKGVKGPKEMQKHIAKLKPNQVRPEEQFNYRFLLASAPTCTYTGRVVTFLSSNSVTAMFSNGQNAVAQVAHAAFQENVHFKFVHADAFVDEIREMQRRWKELEDMPQKARRRWKWLTSVEVRRCYMYHLLLAYQKKLAYEPSKSGTIKGLLENSHLDTKEPYMKGATVRRSQKNSYYIETLEVFSSRVNLQEQCDQVRAQMP